MGICLSRLRGDDMDIITECRYLYRVPAGDSWYLDEYYGSLTAVDMRDAKRALRGNPKREVFRARLGVDGCKLADFGSQEYRKSLFEAAKGDGS